MSLLTVYLVLYILAAACFLGYSVGARHPRVNLLGLGVFFWSLAPLIETISKL